MKVGCPFHANLLEGGVILWNNNNHLQNHPYDLIIHWVLKGEGSVSRFFEGNVGASEDTKDSSVSLLTCLFDE